MAGRPLGPLPGWHPGRILLLAGAWPDEIRHPPPRCGTGPTNLFHRPLKSLIFFGMCVHFFFWIVITHCAVRSILHFPAFWRSFLLIASLCTTIPCTCCGVLRFIPFLNDLLSGGGFCYCKSYAGSFCPEWADCKRINEPGRPAMHWARVQHIPCAFAKSPGFGLQAKFQSGLSIGTFLEGAALPQSRCLPFFGGA